MRTAIGGGVWRALGAGVAAAAMAAGAVMAEAPPAGHPFNATDLQSMLRLSQPQASPQGDRVVFVVRSNDLAANNGGNDLWLVNVDGSGEQPLTTDHAGYDNPRWSADGGALYFLSSRSGSSQIWRLSPVPGKVAGVAKFEQLTHSPVDLTSFAVSRDGKTAVASADVFPDCPTLACTHDRLERTAKSRVKARFYGEGTGFVRHWDVWEDGTRSHLLVFSLYEPGTPVVDLMRGLQADSPSKPEGGPEEYAFTPDDKGVVYAARLAGAAEPWSTNFDLYLAPLDASHPARDLTATNTAADTYPVFSPDGKTLVYAAQARPGVEADRYHVVVRDMASGTERRVAEAWDRSVGPMVFSADGKTLYTTTNDVGQNPLFAIDVASGKVRKLTGEGHADSPVVAGDRLVVSIDDLRHPADLWTVRPDGTGLTQITHFNRERLAGIRMGEFEAFEFAGGNGDTVHGFVVKPVAFTAGKKYPIAYIIHGGPEGSMENHFHYRWNPEVYAGAGYAVVFVDFHGSTGYGQAFTDAIRTDWGGKPLKDLQAGLAAAVARYPWLDGDRACALGASYGGYMINWIEGNWPERFRCLVNHDGVFDQRMMYYSTEELWFMEAENGGPEFQNPGAYEQWNPVRFVDRWRTPMLVIHGGLDFRIPETQGLAAFTALRRRGVPSEMLELPAENHWVLKPADSILWHQTVLAWLERWLAAPPGAPVPQ